MHFFNTKRQNILKNIASNKVSDNPVFCENDSAATLFKETLEKFPLSEIANKLSLHIGTLKRWILKNQVPDCYASDLNFLLNNKYDIVKNFREQDCFYTNPEIAKYCLEKTINILNSIQIDSKDYIFIEPSAGSGSFYNLLPHNRRIGIEIESNENPKIIKENYLNFLPSGDKKYIVIGNPPFGLRGNLALRFINHSTKFADVVAFILPPLFDSNGKGVPMKRVQDYKLIHSEKLPRNSFHYPNGQSVDIATIFQIWSKVNIDLIQVEIEKTCKKFVRIYSLSDGGTPSSTRNKKMLNKCDVYLPSTCFNGMKAYDSFEKLPNRRGYGVTFFQQKDVLKDLFFNVIDWKQVSFLSTNSALNLRTDLIENELINRGFYD